MATSKKYKLNKADGGKIAKGAGIAAGGAVVAYLITLLPMVDFGTQTVVIVPVASVLLNALLKLLKNS